MLNEGLTTIHEDQESHCEIERETRLLKRLFHLRRVMLRRQDDKWTQTDGATTNVLLEAGVSVLAMAAMHVHVLDESNGSK